MTYIESGIFLVQILLLFSPVDVLDVLYDLDETSKRKVNVLDHFKVSSVDI